jgi:vacuolar protein sorting-associated protein IST1
MDFLFGYQEKKLKPFLKMAVQRLQIAGNKKGSACKHAKRDIAKLLEAGKEEKARIKVEHVIREDFTMESYELIELLCELLHERVKYMSSQKECPADLMEAVCTLIWSADRVDIAELNEVKNQLKLKFGKEFAMDAETNSHGKVNERLLEKLSVKPPSAHLVMSYLAEIAKEFDVAWQPTDIGVNDLSAPVNTRKYCYVFAFSCIIE